MYTVQGRFTGKIRPVLILPSLITVSSLFAGFMSIICSIKGNYELSVKYIALSFILDGLDGRVARKFNATSPFGMEFDSLCDLVAFGVAPSILVWAWAFSSDLDEFGVLASFLFVAGGAIRLARFNVSTAGESKSYFVGLPIPAAASCLASLVYAYPNERPSVFFASLIVLYVIGLSFLMVSTYKFESFKKFKISGVDPIVLLLFLCVVVGLIWKFDRVSLFILLLVYALSGPFLSLRGGRYSEVGKEGAEEEMESVANH